MAIPIDHSPDRALVKAKNCSVTINIGSLESQSTVLLILGSIMLFIICYLVSRLSP
eukprot:m.29907 g.29907  ORF g.29907 m.29907 type:complete len:56 (+) comp31255_c0_seq1:705-872(+)